MRQLLEIHEPLLAKCALARPDFIEVSAVAVMLHGFYNGIENLFKRIAVELDGGTPQGDEWHRRLLDAMASPTPTRSAVISQALRSQLREYLDFRHFFRHAYAFQFRWEKMTPLVEGCVRTLKDLEAALEEFLQSQGRAGRS